jgi:CRISPR/Cas system-associated exonuclease Cas4 (RecB family)
MVHNLIKEVLGEYGTPGIIKTSDLIKTIESGYIANVRSGFKQKKSFSPSTLVYGFGACARYWAFAFKGADMQSGFTPWQVANMESGTYGHERIQKAIADSGIMLDKETKMTNDNPPMLGYRDVLVKWDDKELPIEIKTCNDASFEARKNSRKALPYHIEQLLMYMRIGGHDLGAILYENKNTHELLAIPVEMTDAYNRWLDSLFEWMGVVYDAYLDDEIPKKQYRSNSKVCASCPLRTVCDQTDQFGLNIKPLEHLS